MKPVNFVAAAVVLLSLAVWPVSLSHCFAEEVKFGCISMSSVSKHSKRLSSAISEINQMVSESNAKAGDLSKRIKASEARLEKEKGTLNPEEDKKLREEARAMQEEVESLQLDMRTKASFRRKSVENVMKTQLPLAIETVAKSRGISVILLKESLAYAVGIPDVSDKVAEELDSMPALEKGPDSERSPKK